MLITRHLLASLRSQIKGRQLCLLYFGVRTAFDPVDHTILLWGVFSHVWTSGSVGSAPSKPTVITWNIMVPYTCWTHAWTCFNPASLCPLYDWHESRPIRKTVTFHQCTDDTEAYVHGQAVATTIGLQYIDYKNCACAEDHAWPLLGCCLRLYSDKTQFICFHGRI